MFRNLPDPHRWSHVSRHGLSRKLCNFVGTSPASRQRVMVSLGSRWGANALYHPNTGALSVTKIIQARKKHCRKCNFSSIKLSRHWHKIYICMQKEEGSAGIAVSEKSFWNSFVFKADKLETYMYTLLVLSASGWSPLVWLQKNVSAIQEKEWYHTCREIHNGIFALIVSSILEIINQIMTIKDRINNTRQ